MKRKTSKKRSPARIWYTADGRQIPVSKMATDHIINALNSLETDATRKLAAARSLCGGGKFPCTPLVSVGVVDKLSEMDKAELTGFFFPRYRWLQDEMIERNKIRYHELIETLEDQKMGIQGHIDSLKEKLNG